GAVVEGVKTSTAALARELGISQQSVSRLLMELAREGLIEREISGRSMIIRLTNEALELALSLYAKLKEILESPSEIILTGRVFTGLGEGAYYTQIPHYVRQFEERLGFRPYPGTLNLKLIGKEDVLKRMLIEKAAKIEIMGFTNGTRSYGNAKCIMASIGDEKVAIIFVDRTHYPKDVIEVIAPVCLREKLGLKDGDKVILSAQITPIELC
ncbi:MAG: DUF120 domain-containing protein, partial [Nitrososphaerota archaeon]